MKVSSQIKKSALIAAVILSAIVTVKYLQIRSQMAGGGFEPPPEAITAVDVAESDWPEQLHYIGTVKALRGAVFSAEASGRVVSLATTQGIIKEGDLLVELDSEVEAARRVVAEANERRSRAAFDRANQLKAVNSISQALFEQAAADYAAAKAELKAAQAELNRRQIVAPFAGEVGAPRVSVGDYVSVGTPLIPLYDRTELYVDFSVPQQELGQIKISQKVIIHTADKTAEYVVSAIDPAVDQGTRTGVVRASSKGDSSFVPGEFVQGEVVISPLVRAITVPASAVSFAPYGDTVFVLKNNGKGLTAEPRPVILGESRGNLFRVISGLSAGEKIATSGVFKLRPGAAVNVNEKEGPSSEVSKDLPRS